MKGLFRKTTQWNQCFIARAMLKWTQVLFKEILRGLWAVNLLVDIFQTLHICFRGTLPTLHCAMTLSRNIQKQTHTHTPKHTHIESYHTPTDRQSVKTCVCLICLGIKTGRQLRNLRQQSIPQTTCLHHLYEPNDYLQPAVSTERMNKFMWVLWTAWGAKINLHVFHAWIWVIDSQMRTRRHSHLSLIQLQMKTQLVL